MTKLYARRRKSRLSEDAVPMDFRFPGRLLQLSSQRTFAEGAGLKTRGLKGFRMPAGRNVARNREGRRPKAARERTRGDEARGGARAMGI